MERWNLLKFTCDVFVCELFLLSLSCLYLTRLFLPYVCMCVGGGVVLGGVKEGYRDAVTEERGKTCHLISSVKWS